MDSKKRRTNAKNPEWKKNLGTKPCIRKMFGSSCPPSASCLQCRESPKSSPAIDTPGQIPQEHNDPPSSNRKRSLGDQPTTEQTQASLPSSSFSSNCQPLHSSVTPRQPPFPHLTHPHLSSLSSSVSPHVSTPHPLSLGPPLPSSIPPVSSSPSSVSLGPPLPSSIPPVSSSPSSVSLGPPLQSSIPPVFSSPSSVSLGPPLPSSIPPVSSSPSSVSLGPPLPSSIPPVSSSPSLMLAAHAFGHSYTAQSGGTNVAPHLNNNYILGSVYINVSSQQSVDLSVAPQSSDQEDALIQRVKEKHKARLKSRCKHLFEGNARNETLLNNIYTKLYITAGETEGLCNKHEVLQIETASRTCTSEDTPVNCNNIFKPLPGQDRIITTVMTKGIAGIGKTVTVQKFILDWAEGKANSHLDFIFLLPFRDLNLVEKQFSLHGLLCSFHNELREIDAKKIAGCQVLFIFDGLDESQLPLDFNRNKILFDMTEEAPIDVLLTNLIKGNLLPGARLWITSRPAAANQIPRKNITQMTEVRGFNDSQKEEYFRKRFCSDANLANRIISHIKTKRSLNIMCQIPVFCWITAMVLGEMLTNDCKEIPKTISEMYTHFVLIQTNLKNQKYHNSNETDARRIKESDKEIILKLAKLAFEHLKKSNLIFYEKDLIECGLDINVASVKSGLCTEIFKQEDGLYCEKVYCFVHFTIQEYFAALYLLYCYTTNNRCVLESFLHRRFVEEDLEEGSAALLGDNGDHSDASQSDESGESLESTIEENSSLEEEPEEHSESFNDDEAEEVSGSESSELVLHEKPSFHVLLKSALHNALQSVNGHLDLMLRFLLGLSLDSNQRLLQDLLSETESYADSVEETKFYIKEQLRLHNSPERSINLVYCLAEINDNTLTEEVEVYLMSGNRGGTKLSPAKCTTLATVLMSREILDEFDLKKFNTCEEGRKRLIPLIKYCRNALLAGCNLTERSWRVVASAIKSTNLLRKLDLSYNDLQHSRMDLLCDGLCSQSCKLKILRMSSCGITEEGCASLASALRSNPSYLRTLVLCDNNLRNSGVKLLSAGLGSKHCELETLRLSGCLVSMEGCASLASALRSNPSHLRELDLSYNHPGDRGVRLLSDVLGDPLFILNVEHNEECYLKPGLKKYACALTLDPNTAHKTLSLSNNRRTVTWEDDDHLCSPHTERFNDCPQVLCREGLTGCYYWEAECSGKGFHVGVAYKHMSRVGTEHNCLLGYNDKSWSLRLLNHGFLQLSVWHKNEHTVIPTPSSSTDRVGVYLNSSQGILSFYLVYSDTLTHLHTFQSTFTEPLYPAFSVNDYSSVSLC
uniref:NACHT, LRR and PYD domains-containing protein 12 n=1 Tax=Oncorhynchus kisutch TaxID=8019 RepID=A0A8C7JJD7_ONCKI